MELQVLHTRVGDRKKTFDTKTEKGREDTKRAIQDMLRKGTAIFLETQKDTFRVLGYDPKRDTVIVRQDSNPKRGRTARKALRGSDKMTAVAPRAGG